MFCLNINELHSKYQWREGESVTFQKCPKKGKHTKWSVSVLRWVATSIKAHYHHRPWQSKNRKNRKLFKRGWIIGLLLICVVLNTILIFHLKIWSNIGASWHPLVGQLKKLLVWWTIKLPFILQVLPNRGIYLEADTACTNYARTVQLKSKASKVFNFLICSFSWVVLLFVELMQNE